MKKIPWSSVDQGILTDQFAVWRELALRKFLALSGVTGGQSSSYVIGIIRALFSCSRSSWVKASSAICSSVSLDILTKVKPPFKVVYPPCVQLLFTTSELAWPPAREVKILPFGA